MTDGAVQAVTDIPLSGRKAQAARNDQVILEAARDVFVDNPNAPVSAVAKAAGVGISALYKRFASKEDMLARLCRDGLARYVEVAREAVAIADAGEAFLHFMRGIVDTDVHSLTQRLAGRFPPTDEMGPLAAEADKLNRRLLRRAKAAGVVRSDLQVNDLSMLFEQLTAIRIGDAERTRALRHRYLALHLDSLRPDHATGKLPAPPPRDDELGRRWAYRP
jgi:AcrR family transcriptional regulator